MQSMNLANTVSGDKTLTPLDPIKETEAVRVQSPKVERDFKANLHGIGETLDGVGHVGTERTSLRVKGEDRVCPLSEEAKQDSLFFCVC